MSDPGLIPNEFKCPISLSIMTDPVVLECGHTFDRDSLMEWLKTSNGCPTCRKVVNSHKITTNFSMKSMISTLNDPSRPQSSISSYAAEYETVPVDNQVEQKHVTIDSLKEITGSFYEDTNSSLVQVSLTCPPVQKRRAVSFVCVIDVSGSMGCIVGAGEGGKAFTRLDLVKHVLNVLIVSLTEHDTLSLITFSTDTRLIADKTFMTEQNKENMKMEVKKLVTESSTYTGQAIKLAYELASKAPEDCLKSIVLLTDGQDTEGHSILERKFTVTKKDPDVQFNTFGFSNDVESDLLEKLALIGGGMFGFIPDQSMIGTIFINFIANTFNVFAQNVKIKIDRANFDFYNKTELQKIVLQYGKTRNILLKRKTKSKDAPQLAIGFNDENMINITLEEQAISDSFVDQNARYKMIELLQDNHLELHKLKGYEKIFKPTPNFLKELNQGRENDMNNEQIKLSLKNTKTWGSHYIRSFKFAHLHEQCLNFKAPSMKMYTNTKFNERVDNLTDLFCTLPPPKPTGINYSNDVRQPRLNMRNIMDADAGCILGSCNIKLANGQSKQLIDVAKGDILEDGSKVVCILKTKFHGEMVKIDNLVITPYHPIIYDHKWQLPIDVLIANSDKKDTVRPGLSMIKAPEPNWVCTLVLDRNHVMNIEGYRCISLGHGFTEEVLKHDYYGTEKILENLAEMKGWENGEISLISYKLRRDSAGCVDRMIKPVYA